MKFKDKVAIVTGSTSGIGEATAKRMAQEGAKVVIVGRRAERGQQIVEEIKAEKGDALYIQTDMVEQDQVENLVEKTIEAYGQIDILVNNAGTIVERPLFRNHPWRLELLQRFRRLFLCADDAAGDPPYAKARQG